MTKQIEDYTVDELSAKINAIKAERERTANALKRYEEELERRKQEVPLGVPCDGEFYVARGGAAMIDIEGEEEASKVNFNAFNSKESAEQHAEMLLAWRKSLVSNSKGEPIDIKVLLPLLKKGWVAMDKDGYWCWYKEKPQFHLGLWNNNSFYIFLSCFNIKPAENWEECLQECGL